MLKLSLSAILLLMVRLNKNSKKNKIILVLLALVALGVVIVVLEKTHVINLYSKDSGATVSDRTTSTTETAQEDFNDGDQREPGNSLSEDEGSGGVEDTNGSITPETDTSSPLVSETGEITVYAPKNNTPLTSGQILAGRSTLPKVSYRLIDSSTGMIAAGELNVVNGNFSGKINFVTGARDGRLDIFGTRADLSEFSNVEIPVRFMQ